MEEWAKLSTFEVFHSIPLSIPHSISFYTLLLGWVLSATGMGWYGTIILRLWCLHSANHILALRVYYGTQNPSMIMWLPYSCSSHLSVGSIVPRPRLHGKTKKWPGIHCLSMHEKSRYMYFLHTGTCVLFLNYTWWVMLRNNFTSLLCDGFDQDDMSSLPHRDQGKVVRTESLQ